MEPVPARDAPTPAAQPGAVVTPLRVVPWIDPVVEVRGFDPRSAYVETFWLSVLGPSATFLLRRLAAELARSPNGVELDVRKTARALGLGTPNGPGAPFFRAIGRCVRFGAARAVGSRALAVRRRLGPISARHLALLSPDLQELHRHWPMPGQPAAAQRGAL